MVAATRASGMVILKSTHPRFIVAHMSQQCALGLKSDASATGAPLSMSFRVGGSGSLRR